MRRLLEARSGSARAEGAARGGARPGASPAAPRRGPPPAAREAEADAGLFLRLLIVQGFKRSRRLRKLLSRAWHTLPSEPAVVPVFTPLPALLCPPLPFRSDS